MKCLLLISSLSAFFAFGSVLSSAGSEYYVVPESSSLGASGLIPRKIYKSAIPSTTTYVYANGRPISSPTVVNQPSAANDYALGHGIGSGLGSGLGTGLTTGLSKSLDKEAGTSAALGSPQALAASGKLGVRAAQLGYGGFGRGYDPYDPYDSYDPYDRYDPFRRQPPRLAQSGYHLGYKLGHGVGYGLGYGLGQGIGKGLNTGLDGGNEDDNGGGGGGGGRRRGGGRSGKLQSDSDGKEKEDKSGSETEENKE